MLGIFKMGIGVQPGLRLFVDDLYLPQGGMIRVQPANLSSNLGALRFTITALETGISRRYDMPLTMGEWRLTLDWLDPGLYRIRLDLLNVPGDVQPVHQLFEVVAPPTA